MSSPPVSLHHSDDDTAVLELCGALTVCQANELHRTALAILEDGRDLIVSCDQVERLDSSSLQILIGLRYQLAAQGRKVDVRGVSRDLDTLLHLAGIDGHVTWERTTEVA